MTLDTELMAAADLVDFEQVDIYDITNGQRLSTYVIPGEAGSGTICINGAAARLVNPGDLIIIASYADYTETEIEVHQPRIVQVDASNRRVPAVVDSLEDC